jgi:hypothetical protein
VREGEAGSGMKLNALQRRKLTKLQSNRMQPAGRDEGGTGRKPVGARDEEDAVSAMLVVSSGDIVQQRGK